MSPEHERDKTTSDSSNALIDCSDTCTSNSWSTSYQDKMHSVDSDGQVTWSHYAIIPAALALENDGIRKQTTSADISLIVINRKLQCEIHCESLTFIEGNR